MGEGEEGQSNDTTESNPISQQTSAPASTNYQGKRWRNRPHLKRSRNGVIGHGLCDSGCCEGRQRQRAYCASDGRLSQPCTLAAERDSLNTPAHIDN